MGLISLSQVELDSQLYSVFAKFSSSERRSDFAQNASPCKPFSSNGKLPESTSFLSSKWIHILGYLIIYHYCSDEILRCYLFLDLADYLSKNPEFFWTTTLLSDKSLFLKWLLKQETISRKGFFGNIACVKNLDTCWSKIRFNFERRIHPKRVLRRRGYKDKGTLLNPDQRIRRQILAESDLLCELQLTIEREREQRREDCLALEEFLLDQRQLSAEQILKFRLKNRKEIYNVS
jgi:hypothetical protein